MSGVTVTRGRLAKKRSYVARLGRNFAECWQLYVLLLLPVIYYCVFVLWPMLGLQIAFKNYVLTKGIWGSEWSGFDKIVRFVNSYRFWEILRNTILLSVYQLLASFPVPILLALAINYIPNRRYAKAVQLVSYAPHFISTVVIVGMIMQIIGSRNGMVSRLAGTYVDVLGNPNSFRHLYVWSGVWQNAGYNAIIYIAALAGISDELHEAAKIDGANILQRILHIDIPGILPQATILLILNTGRMLNIGFEKVYLLQNSLNIEKSEIISTYVYKIGIAANFPDFSYSTAIGLFQSVVSLILITVVNKVAGTISENSLW